VARTSRRPFRLRFARFERADNAARSEIDREYEGDAGFGVPIRNVSFTSIVLKNSFFRGDHNSGDRRQPR
jgi:hypothetical protein